MQANFDGMRRNATSNMNVLGKVLYEEILSKDEFDMPVELKEKMVEAFNDAAQSVDVMNCLYDDAVEGDMNDLSDVLEIDRLEISHEVDEDNF